MTDNWISVADRLPTEADCNDLYKRKVLVWNAKMLFVSIEFAANIKRNREITHWQPLPKTIGGIPFEELLMSKWGEEDE